MHFDVWKPVFTHDPRGCKRWPLNGWKAFTRTSPRHQKSHSPPTSAFTSQFGHPSGSLFSPESQVPPFVSHRTPPLRTPWGTPDPSIPRLQVHEGLHRGVGGLGVDGLHATAEHRVAEGAHLLPRVGRDRGREQGESRRGRKSGGLGETGRETSGETRKFQDLLGWDLMSKSVLGPLMI